MSEITKFVGVILIDDQERVALQLREPDRDLNPDRWSVFGGHIEKGETPDQAAIREIKEELSIDLSPIKLESLGRFMRENHAFNIFIYSVSSELDQVELKEGCGWRWWNQKEIREGVVEGKKIVNFHAQFLLQLLEKRASGRN